MMQRRITRHTLADAPLGPQQIMPVHWLPFTYEVWTGVAAGQGKPCEQRLGGKQPCWPGDHHNILWVTMLRLLVFMGLPLKGPLAPPINWPACNNKLSAIVH